MRRVFSFATSSFEDLKANTTQPLSNSQSENIITHKKKKEKIRQKKDIITEEEVNNMEYIGERKKQNRKSYIQPPPQGYSGHAKEKKSRLSKYVEPHDFLGNFSFEETIKEEENGDEKIKKSKKKSNGLKDMKEKRMSRGHDNYRDSRNSTTLEVVDNDKFYISITNNNSLPQGFRRPTPQYGYPDLNVNNTNNIRFAVRESDDDDDDDDDDDLPLGIRLQQNRSVNSVNSINSINSANSLGSSNYYHNRSLSSASSLYIEELPKYKMSKRHSGFSSNSLEYSTDNVSKNCGVSGKSIPPLSPTPTPVIPTSRMRNLSLNMVRPRTDSFTRNIPPPRRASDGAVLALPTVPPNEKDSKRMSTLEYHRYQQELIAAQYQRHGVNPLPVSDEQHIESLNPGRPTLIQVSQEYKNNISTIVEAVNAQPNNPRRLNELNENAQIRSKRLSCIDGGRRMNLVENNPTSSGRLSENSLYYGENRRINPETTIMQQQLYLPRAPQPQRNSTIVNLPSKFQHSATSLSSGSTNLSSSGGSGGPPTPKNKRSSSVTIMGEGGNYIGVGNNSGSGNSRSSTPSSIGSIGVGYMVEKNEREKRKKGTLKIK